MKQNMNTIDRFIRMTAGVILLILASVTERDMVQLLIGIAGLGLIVTAILGTCPILALLAGISSSSRKKKRRLY